MSLRRHEYLVGLQSQNNNTNNVCLHFCLLTCSSKFTAVFIGRETAYLHLYRTFRSAGNSAYIYCSNGYRIPLSNTFLLLDTVVALQFEKYWFNHWASSLRSFRISVYNMQTMLEGWGRGGTNWGFVVLNGETRNAVKAIFNHGRICGSACYFESGTQKYIFMFIFLTCRNFSFSCRFQGLDPSERNLWLGVYKAQLTKIAIVVDF
jgi:hypothetical protein